MSAGIDSIVIKLRLELYKKLDLMVHSWFGFSGLKFCVAPHLAEHESWQHQTSRSSHGKIIVLLPPFFLTEQKFIILTNYKYAG